MKRLEQVLEKLIFSESEVITDCANSVGILDDKTIRENHPWYTDEVEERLKAQKLEEQKAIEEYKSTFPEDVKADG